MNKGLMIIMGMLLFTLAARATTYHLERVDQVVNGGQYVFVNNNNMALDAETLDKGALLVKSFDAEASLQGNETYIWTWSKRSESDYALICGETIKLTVSSNNKSRFDFLSVTSSASNWQFEFNSDNKQASIYTYTTTTDKRYVAPNDAMTAYTPKTSNTNAYFTIYRLVPDTYERVVGSTNLGTLCLPFAVDEYSGADIYEIAYKELDEYDKPSKMYYQQVEGRLEAGYPYMIVPKAAGTITFTAVHGEYVNQPIPVNGFYGTFNTITKEATLEGNYMINATSQFQLCGKGCSLGANRAYIKMNEVPTKNQVAAPTRQVMVIGQSSQPEFYDPTSTEIYAGECTTPSVSKVIRDGKLVIVKGNKQYNTLGQQL